MEFESHDCHASYRPVAVPTDLGLVRIALGAKMIESGFKPPAHVRKRSNVLPHGYPLKTIRLNLARIAGGGRYAAGWENIGNIKSARAEIVIAHNYASRRKQRRLVELRRPQPTAFYACGKANAFIDKTDCRAGHTGQVAVIGNLLFIW